MACHSKRILCATAALCFLPLLSIRAQIDGLYVSGEAGNWAGIDSIFKITNTGNVSIVVTGLIVNHLVIDSGGNLYTAQTGPRPVSILKIDGTGVVSTLATLPYDFDVLSMAIDNNDILFILTRSGLFKVAPTGALSKVAPMAEYSGAITFSPHGDFFEVGFESGEITKNALSPSTGLVIVSDVVAGRNPQVPPSWRQKFTTWLSKRASNIEIPICLACGPDGCVYVGCYGNEKAGLPGKIFKVTPAGAISKFAESSSSFTDIAFNSRGDMFAATGNAIYVVSKTGALTPLVAGLATNPLFIAISPGFNIAPEFKYPPMGVAPAYPSPMESWRVNAIRIVAAAGIALTIICLAFLWLRRRKRIVRLGPLQS